MSAVETLTDEERAWLDESCHVSAVRKALRIIDAHAADRAALVAQLEAARAELAALQCREDTFLAGRLAALDAADHAAIETIRELKSELESAIREQVELKAERDEARAAQSVAAQFNQNLTRDKTRLIWERDEAERAAIRLTDDERRLLWYQAGAAGEKAIRISYQLTALVEENVRLRSALVAAETSNLCPCGEKEARLIAAEARVRDLTEALAAAERAAEAAVSGNALATRRARDADLRADDVVRIGKDHIEQLRGLLENEEKNHAFTKSEAATERAELLRQCDLLRGERNAAEARVEALETLLAASEARAAQWQADAESYRADATVAQDRLAALKAKVAAALLWAEREEWSHEMRVEQMKGALRG